MERSEHLKFCKVCTNRRMSSSKGLVCSITGEIADFEDKCPDYVLDEKEQQELKTRFKNKDIEWSVSQGKFGSEPLYVLPKHLQAKISRAYLVLCLLYLGINIHYWIFDNYLDALPEELLTINLLFFIFLLTGSIIAKFRPFSWSIAILVVFLLYSFFWIGLLVMYSSFMLAHVTLIICYTIIVIDLYSQRIRNKPKYTS